MAATASGETDGGASSKEETPEDEGREVSKGLGSADATGDIDNIELVIDEFGTPTVNVTVTNRSEKRSDYSLTVVAESADGSTRYDETWLHIGGLEPGQTVTESTIFTGDVPEDAAVDVIEVQRTASLGEQGLGSKDASADVSEPKLLPAEHGMQEVEVTVTNKSEKRSDYAITIVAESGDGSTRYDETWLHISGLEPGQTKTDTAMFFDELPEDAVLRYSEIQRTAS